MAIFYDTHAHLGFPDFAGDLAQVVERAAAAGIAKIITIGTDLEGSRRAIEIAEKFPAVFAAVGWHPTHVLEAPDDIREALMELGKHPKVVAIGETGLDYYRRPKEAASDELFARYKSKQASIFRQQLEVAAALGLNCVVHQRDSFEDTLAQLEPFSNKVRGVFHCFAEPPENMRRVVELGSLVSFTGILTFKSAATIRASLAAAPADRFMLETDCPFLAPTPYRGKRCEPAFVKELAQGAAETRGCSLEELSAATCATAGSFFPKMRDWTP
jgi:TatD DNase family protein